MNAVLYMLAALSVGAGALAGCAVVPRRWRLSAAEVLTVGSGATVLVLASIAPVLVLVPATRWPVAAAVAAATAVGLRRLLRRWESEEATAEVRLLVCLFITQVLAKAALSTAWEYPAQGGDWFIHAVSIPARFARGEWAPPGERPALFSLAALAAHRLAGLAIMQYWFSQLVSVALNSLLLFPAFGIARRLAGNRAAVSAALLVSVNFFLWYQGLYTWPKNLAAFFALAALYFLVVRDREPSRRDAVLAGVAMGLAYLAHPLALFYVVAYGLVALGRGRALARSHLPFWIAAAITVTPQFVWSYVASGTLSLSSMAFYPFVLDSWEDVHRYDLSALLARFAAAPWHVPVVNRLYSVAATLFDLSGLHDERRYLAFYDSLWVGLGGVLLALGVLGVVRGFRRSAVGADLAMSGIVLPFALLALFTGWPTGLLGGMGLHPAAVLLIVFAAALAEEAPDAIWRWGLGILVATSLARGLGDWLGLQTFYERYEAASNRALLGASGPHYVPGFHLDQLVSAQRFVGGLGARAACALMAGFGALLLERYRSSVATDS